MDKSKIFGFWQEIDGDTFPSLKDVPFNTLSNKETGYITHYLENCPIWIASPGIVFSFFNPEEIAGTPSIRTDGHWAWPETIAYYVKTYKISPPIEFIQHVKKRQGIAPSDLEVRVDTLVFPEL